MASGYVLQTLTSIPGLALSNLSTRTILICSPVSSLKDTSKALNNVFANTSSLRTLPEDVHNAIQAYLSKYENIDDHDSQRLHEELVSVYNKHVANEPGKQSGFLQALRLFQPAIKGENRLTEWWTLIIKPTIDGLGHKRDGLENAGAFLLGILDYDADEDTDGEHSRVSQHFTKLLLGAYLKRTQIADAEGELLTLEDSYVANQLESVLIGFGRRKPKVCLS
jgi:hypothetical protein